MSSKGAMCITTQVTQALRQTRVRAWDALLPVRASQLHEFGGCTSGLQAREVISEVCHDGVTASVSAERSPPCQAEDVL